MTSEMDPGTVQELWRYGSWASERLLEPLLELSPEQYTRNLGGSFASVQATLTHIVWAEWVWLERWQGRPPTTVLDPAEFPTPADAASRWREVRQDQGRYLADLSAAQLRQPLRYLNLKGEAWEYPLWRQVFHVLNHSTHHRGQLTHMLRQLGVAPPTTDFLDFCDSTSGPPDPGMEP